MGSCFTVFFEDPFWVGILEVEEGGGYWAARHVFGAEPGNAELVAFMLGHFHELYLRRPPPGAGSLLPVSRKAADSARNPKRAQREARRDLQGSTSTRSQAALSASLEARKAGAKASRREALSEAEALRFQLRARKRKERRRGH